MCAVCMCVCVHACAPHVQASTQICEESLVQNQHKQSIHNSHNTCVDIFRAHSHAASNKEALHHGRQDRLLKRQSLHLLRQDQRLGREVQAFSLSCQKAHKSTFSSLSQGTISSLSIFQTHHLVRQASQTGTQSIFSDRSNLSDHPLNRTI